MSRLNAELPTDVRVRDVQIVRSDFAAMSSLWKRYVYTIPPNGNVQQQQPSSVNQSVPSESKHSTSSTVSDTGDGHNEDLSALTAFCRKTLQNSAGASSVARLDLALMRSAAAALEGKHDFASFQSKGGRKTTVRGSCTFLRPIKTSCCLCLPYD